MDELAIRGEFAERERGRLVDELARANHRLSGILEIVLSTIDSGDVGVLFTRTMEQVCQTLEASAALLYLYEDGRLRLRGWSDDAAPERLPQRIAAAHLRLDASDTLEEALRLRVLTPSKENLRQGELRERELLDERTGVSFRVPSGELPPYASMLMGPVWFGGQLIAVLVVGWERVRRLSSDDARLLGAVDRYLSTQLAGALSTLRQQRTLELAEAETHLRELLIGLMNDDGESEAAETVGACMTLLADVLSCEVGIVHETGVEGTSELELAGSDVRVLSVDFDTIVPEGRMVCEFGLSDVLSEQLAAADLPATGAAVDVGSVKGTRVALLILRKDADDALDELELAFLQRLGEDARDASRAGERRGRDRQIAQALQTGMRNELQQVDGLTAAGLYSSATQAAFVGGDFYDLIRLPEGRACVIMGDVSGKGVEAASVSAAVKTALGAYSWEGLRPARMVSLLNEFLLGFSRLETFATLFVGVIDVATGRLTYCSAGHPPAIIVRSATGELALCSVQSGVVGAFSEMTYRNGRTTLAPGDILMLYTDGTTEARTPEGAFFGEEGLREALLAEVPAGFDGLLDRLLARLDEFTGRRLEDDVAMVALRYDGFGE